MIDEQKALAILEVALQRYYNAQLKEFKDTSELTIYKAKEMYDEYYQIKELAFEKFNGHKRFEPPKYTKKDMRDHDD